MATTTDDLSLGIAIQPAKGSSPAGSYTGLLLTELDAWADYDVDPLDDETGGSLAPGSGGVRLSTWTPVSMAGRVRAETIPWILRTMGLDTTVSAHVSGTVWTHTFTPSAGASTYPWAAILYKLGALWRVLDDGRGDLLNITAAADSVAMFGLDATATHEEIATGSEAEIAEGGQPLVTVAGSLTLTYPESLAAGAWSGGGYTYNEEIATVRDIAGKIRYLSLSVENEYPDTTGDIDLADYENNRDAWLGIYADGEMIATFDPQILAALYYDTETGAGAGYSFDDAIGDLDLTLESHALIPGSSTPYSLRIECPNVVIRGGDVESERRTEITIPLLFSAYADGADPMIRFTLTTDLADLDRTLDAGAWSGGGYTYNEEISG